MDTDNKITPIEGTVYMDVAMTTEGAVKRSCDGTIVYLNAEAAASPCSTRGHDLLLKDTAHPVTIN